MENLAQHVIGIVVSHDEVGPTPSHYPLTLDALEAMASAVIVYTTRLYERAGKALSPDHRTLDACDVAHAAGTTVPWAHVRSRWCATLERARQEKHFLSSSLGGEAEGKEAEHTLTVAQKKVQKPCGGTRLTLNTTPASRTETPPPPPTRRLVLTVPVSSSKVTLAPEGLKRARETEVAKDPPPIEEEKKAVKRGKTGGRV